MIFLASTDKHSEYRKPNIGMWNFLSKKIFKEKVDKKQSFYCGDAAGRKGNGFNDFSADDYMYSINLGLQFYTPEMLFKGEPINYKPIGTGSQSTSVPPKSSKKLMNLAQDKVQEMILFVGSPGSGKSTLYRDHLSHLYARINNDTCKNPSKNEKMCK